VLFGWTVIGVFMLELAFDLLIFFAACVAAARRRPNVTTALLWRRYAHLAPSITLIAPAFNEAATIVESVESLLALEYPAFEVIVVNDGSSDDTLERLTRRFGLKPIARLCERAAPHEPIRGFHASPRVPRLLVVDKENGGGKADAVNAGINASRTDLLCITDADTLVEPDALLRAIRPFVLKPRTIAVGGKICIANGSRVHRGRVVEAHLPRNYLALVQALEYERAFMLARLGLSSLGAMLIVSGAFGLFRRDAVVAVGGYSLRTVGEDLDLVVKLHRHFRSSGIPYEIAFLADPVVWTQAPESLADLGSQRSRWQRGALETFWKNRSMTFNPRYGAAGLLGFTQIFLEDVLMPVLAVAGYVLMPVSWSAGLISGRQFVAFLIAVFSFGILMSLLSIIFEQILVAKVRSARALAILAAVAVLENFGYRQLSQLWRLRGWYQFLSGKKGWGAMQRREFERA